MSGFCASNMLFLLHDSVVYFEIRFCDTSRNQLFVQEFLFFGRSKSLRILCFFFCDVYHCNFDDDCNETIDLLLVSTFSQ
jgi:hypothetical protein